MKVAVDQEYIRMREKLIPEAEKFVNKQFGSKAGGKSEPEKRKYAAQWSKCFHEKMNRLVRERGI